VREDYGATLGSHVYDCSVVLLRFLRDELRATRSHPNWHHGSVLELGSGCGLLGLWLATHFDHAFLTDKACQVDLLRANVQLNDASWGASRKVDCLPLDWADGPSGLDLAALLACVDAKLSTGCDLPPAPLSLVVAADVFYDGAAAQAMFSVIDAVRRTGSLCGPLTRVILAQKLRSDATPLPHSCRVLREERQVRILELARSEDDQGAQSGARESSTESRGTSN